MLHSYYHGPMDISCGWLCAYWQLDGRDTGSFSHSSPRGVLFLSGEDMIFLSPITCRSCQAMIRCIVLFRDGNVLMVVMNTGNMSVWWRAGQESSGRQRREEHRIVLVTDVSLK